MALHRVYQPEIDSALLAPGATVEITAEEARYAAAIKRLRAGERVEIFSGRGFAAVAHILSVSRRSISAQVIASSIAPRPRPEVIIACPPPKGSRAEAMIDQLSQVGVSRFLPLITARSIVEPRETRIDKWRTITAVESARQCGRAWLMEIDEPVPLEACLTRPDRPLLVLADAQGRPCGEALARTDTQRPVLLLVGPEGGFSDEEHALIDAGAATRLSLGPHILRVETAALLGAGLVIQSLARQV